jgi:hypothetical protein
MFILSHSKTWSLVRANKQLGATHWFCETAMVPEPGELPNPVFSDITDTPIRGEPTIVKALSRPTLERIRF